MKKPDHLRALPGPLMCPCVAKDSAMQHRVTASIIAALLKFKAVNNLCNNTVFAAVSQIVGADIAGRPEAGFDDHLQAVFDHIIEGFNKTSDTHTIRITGLQVEYKRK